MKNLTPTHGQNTSAETESAADVTRQGARVLQATIKRVSFWAAILLPVVYLPLLSGGLGPQNGYIVIGLLALNLIALFVGHSHTHQ